MERRKDTYLSDSDIVRIVETYSDMLLRIALNRVKSIPAAEDIVQGVFERLMRLVGMGKAKELIFSARNVKAPEALEIGLVNAVYPPEELLPAAKKLGARIAKNAPIAVRACKAAMNEGIDLPMDEAVDAEIREFSGCFETEDQKRGMTAFLNKQKNVEFENR